MRKFSWVALMVLASSFPALARTRAHAGSAVYKYSIEHGKDLMVTITGPGGAESDVTDQVLVEDATLNAFDVGHSSRVQIVIENANPLLYKYEVKDKEQKVLKSSEDLETFGKSIAQLQESFATLAGKSIEAASAVPLTACQEFMNLAKDVASKVAEIDKVRIDSQNQPEELPGILSTWKTDKWRRDYDKWAPELVKQAVNPTPCPDTALALALRSDVDAAISQLAKVKDLAEQVGKPLLLDTITVDRSHFTNFTIHVEKNGKWPSGLEPRAFLGDRKSSVSPYESVPVRLVPSMVYSFVDQRTYEAKPAGDKFVVTETKKEVTGLDLSAALEFSPKALDFTTFNGVVQLGVSPQKNIGLFLGTGINVPSVFTFGVGVTYQQVNRLGAGLTPNQTIDKADALKTNKKFASGLYFFITIPKKK